MQLDLIFVRSVVTVALFVLFILLCLWAWSDRRHAEFEAAAHLPFEEFDRAAPVDVKQREEH
jgi:cbb3-type cytochrome oxidase subunit 3